MKASGMFRYYNDTTQDPAFTTIYELDLTTVVPSLSGPKRPQDRVSQSDLKMEFNRCLSNKVFHFSILLLLSIVRALIVFCCRIRLVFKVLVLMKAS